MYTSATTAWRAIQTEQEMIRVNSYRAFYCLFALLQLIVLPLEAQEKQVFTTGEVSYLSGNNVYVRFASTEGIENGDSLLTRQQGLLVPALVVRQKSSISCLCSTLEDFHFQLGDTVLFMVDHPEPETVPGDVINGLPEKDAGEQAITSTGSAGIKPGTRQDITGRISVSSYSGFPDPVSGDSHRFRYTVSMQAANLANTSLSFETYVTFTHKLHQWDVVTENIYNALKIYNLALKYDFNGTTSLWAGRKLNPKIANAGAVDGLQLEKNWKQFFIGAVAGTRPDYLDYSHNFQLPEYGAYAGHSVNTRHGYFQTTLAFFEQRNQSATDRRFIYLQHSNSALRQISIFSSLELDLYELENGQPKNSLNLISLYFSARYSVNKRLSLFGSYDNRKNVIYYETFRNYADEILQQASRQGFRLRVNYRPADKLIFGVSAGTRKQNKSPEATKTLNGQITHTMLPVINGLFMLSANFLETPHLGGQIFGAHLSKDIMARKLNSAIRYRYVNFNYSNSGSSLQQNIADIDFGWFMSRKWYFSVNYEVTLQDNYDQNRLFINLRYRL